VEAAGDIPPGEAELIQARDGLGPLEEAWRDLAVARGNAFVTPEWFWTWIRHYGDDHSPAVAVVRGSGGEFMGVLPFARGSGRSRLLRFAGSSLGDHFEPAALAGHEGAVAAAAGRALAATGRLPAVVVENVDEEADWWRDLAEATGARAAPLTDRHLPLPGARLDGQTWQEFMARRSRNLRSQLSRKRKTLERDHEVAVRWSGPDDDIEADMAALFRLHDLRWTGRQTGSTMVGDRVRAFHTDFAGVARERGWLRLAFLIVDSQPVAGWYGWRIGERFAYYQAGFDPAWGDRSVGLLLFAETIRAALEEGAAEYDMLLGDEGFKLRFADSERRVCTALIAPPLHPSRIAAAAEIRARRISRRVPVALREPLKRQGRAVLDRLPLARRR
jgi:CelD/BcsL family acetyltransferase involved in cellulose biosynthesis